MSYTIDWDMVALNRAAQFMNSDVAGVEQVVSACDLLAENPRPTGSFAYGTPDVRRIHIGRYRVLYEINEAQQRITIARLGRVE
ncbi:type II toxin-antitoxin system RelE/ParE family toxin [Catenulispora sp. NF23]|uniref:Type II toxin-antitoxin system RelE/ParE family toxin n=1 Tax=Catenulispora pinistramenti TaxID=2705254 RepID=A0ABS5KLR2_9ACTN|nr:type II toxin-antitoxin system RelE/ParE family toxin [Catenulispora pinistramenti]MBS2531471.1 type II toxin-antitoxin system RelE/ParE family toxin [Catenulispora pinistramenti]MBS2546991.1 type II toxin-antitoxin system RelE/ParE family toxin [Catenulispora pinistramenti]